MLGIVGLFAKNISLHDNDKYVLLFSLVLVLVISISTENPEIFVMIYCRVNPVGNYMLVASLWFCQERICWAFLCMHVM